MWDTAQTRCSCMGGSHHWVIGSNAKCKNDLDGSSQRHELTCNVTRRQSMQTTRAKPKQCFGNPLCQRGSSGQSSKRYGIDVRLLPEGMTARFSAPRGRAVTSRAGKGGEFVVTLDTNNEANEKSMTVWEEEEEEEEEEDGEGEERWASMASIPRPPPRPRPRPPSASFSAVLRQHAVRDASCVHLPLPGLDGLDPIGHNGGASQDAWTRFTRSLKTRQVDFLTVTVPSWGALPKFRPALRRLSFVVAHGPRPTSLRGDATCCAFAFSRVRHGQDGLYTSASTARRFRVSCNTTLGPSSPQAGYAYKEDRPDPLSPYQQRDT
ncbi:uncharacterized protein MYCFIDRAFT_173958 [Pseudocercospora fijiensis CIRAD86]|uniref:Uncharacterized protein n=1 Tax=Pseudocercospora fijiensis (strain CIRAD86) TaxID=383855 RepID=M3B6Z0_PSEFD|nr:uncharacterized protein MYCFIDRAFT_173958 [Pseudocercospora fijiensis CIRAD86]EME85098.1 hypothetical protein MYCFIDRAFT_173958 [Pseudocercospora fijiensis CIRAD86]